MKELVKENINELEIGQTQYILVLVKSIENAATRNGVPYQKLTVRDAHEHEVPFFNWDSPISLPIPTVARVQVETREYKSEQSYKFICCEEAAGANIEVFLPKGNIDSKKAWSDLVEICCGSTKTQTTGIRFTLRKIVGGILMDQSKKFRSRPLTKSDSYSRRSGIIEATLNLVKAAEAMADIQPLDHDLIIAGAMLYYIGNVNTINDVYAETPDDILLTAGNIASDLILLKSVDLKSDDNLEEAIDDEDIRLLRHIVTSRFKGIKAAIPEAVVLRYLDTALQETDLTFTSMKEMEYGSMTTNNRLFNNRLYKREPIPEDAQENTISVA